MDYGVYAEGEARLGWVNGEYEVGERRKAKGEGRKGKNGGVDGNGLLEKLAGEIRKAFVKRKVEVAHLKISLEEGEVGAAKTTNHSPSTSHAPRLGVIQWVRSGIAPEFTQRFDGPVRGGRLLLNLRAEAAPEFLSQAVKKALAAVSGEAVLREVEYAAFQPSPPKPTHRLTEVGKNGETPKKKKVPAARTGKRVRA